jgi:hypothetical protein
LKGNEHIRKGLFLGSIGGMPKTVIQLLNIEPNHDEIAVFREVININGYKVLSEDLAPIVNAITEQW